MITRPRHLAHALVVALGLGLAACSGESDGPTTATPPPRVGGDYYVNWTLQVLRKSDGFQKQFVLRPMTLVQNPPVGSTSTLSGLFVDRAARPSPTTSAGASAQTGCRVHHERLPPPEGPCPGGKNLRYSGHVRTDDNGTTMRTRGVTTVTCPQFGSTSSRT
jgi:hypothetical protein